MTPRVSVIIRTYNRADYVAQAIDSVLSQTFTDLELIVVDNSSTDDTPDVLAGYGGRIRVLSADRSVSHAGVFNVGIAAAQGAFIAFLDSDDVWMPEKLERQIQRLDEDPRFGFSYTNAQLLYPDGSVSPPALMQNQMVAGSVLRTMVRNMCIHPSTALLRASMVQRVGGFDERHHASEDFFYFLKLARITDAVCIREPLCLIRQHAQQRSREVGLANYEAAIEALTQLVGESSLAPSVRLEAHRSLARYHAHVARVLVEQNRVAEGRDHALQAIRWYPLYRRTWKVAALSFRRRAS